MDAKNNVTAIHPDWLVPSDDYGWATVVMNTLPLLLLCVLLTHLADWSMWLAWACCPLVGLWI